MKRRFTEERIIGPVKEHESGVETGDSCRRPPDNSVSVLAEQIRIRRINRLRLSQRATAQAFKLIMPLGD